jgi:glycosyltransferase involved in cell wall biosynthesis
MNGRLLVFNCHEAWVYQLRLLNLPIDIVVDLPGRHTREWDRAIRPIPPSSRLISLSEVQASRETYDCIIAHNLTDLLDVKALAGPRLLMIHLTLDGMILEQQAKTNREEFRRAVAQFVEITRAHVVAVSRLKGRSWGFEEDVVPLCAEPAEYLPWEGNLAKGLRIASFVKRRPQTLLWEFHQNAFADVPVTLVGHNPEIAGVRPSANWANLKEILQRHRFYIHTADPKLEDGYNTATLEAMAAGLPVLGNCHPSSPVVHGVSGFLSNDADEVKSYAKRLLADRELARGMGEAARRTVAEKFSPESFRVGMLKSIERTRKKWEAGRVVAVGQENG